MKKLSVLSILLAIVIPCSASTITVNWDGTGDHTTIQAAIDDANDFDTVIVADGTYTGDGNRDIDFFGKALTVRSENGSSNCTINCQGSVGDPHRGFYFNNGEGANSILDGFTIINGHKESGGGIYCYGSSPTIKNCVISQNTGLEIIEIICDPCDPCGPCFYDYWGIGGGISCELGSTAHIINCDINNNSAFFGGNGISCDESDPVIENCKITDNSGSERGGGVYGRDSSPTIKNCLIAGNSTIEYGGGIFVDGDYTPFNIINCTITDNTAAWGGSVGLITTTATISNCILWGNSPSEIAMTATGSATVTYSDVQGGYSGVGNIDLNPEFAALGDYHLLFGSPCIDAGTNSPPTGLPAADLDGLSRPFDGNFDDIAIADMGAYEFHTDPNSPILALTPARFRFTCPEGGPSPAGKILEVWNAGGSLLNWQIEEDCEWLRVDSNTGSSIGEIDQVILIIDANDLASDMYNYTLAVSNADDSSDVRYVSVELRVGPVLLVPSEYSTIQAAIDAAFDGDEVVVADGIYTGSGNRDIDFSGKAITVRSESHDPYNCIIDCQGSTSAEHRGFYFHSCEDRDSILDGFTITNGYLFSEPLPEGGGIFCLNACTKPTIRNCIITGNSAYSGGGISCYGSSPKISNCIITNNEAYYDKGGGILCWNYSNAKIIGCTICDNEAKYYGGGIFFYGGGAKLKNSILWGNTAGTGNQIRTHMGDPTVSYCDVQGGWSGTGNINIDPQFVDRPGGNYHLSISSPCIDSGDPDFSPAPEEWDIDVEPRVMGGRVDIGADEVSEMLTDFDDNRVVDISDFSILSEGWLGSSGQGTWNEDCDTNQDGSVNEFDFLTLVKSWLNEADSEAPSTPANLAVAGVTTETVSLVWDTSTDNVSVAGYKVYRDGSYVGWSGSTNFTDDELEPGTTYTYRVSAYDTEYNESALSAACQATTNQ